MSRHTEDGRAYRAARRAYLQDHPQCWICGHMGSDQIDHDPPRVVHKANLDYSTWRPAHGVHGCPTCGRRCNQERGTRAFEPVHIDFAPAMTW